MSDNDSDDPLAAFPGHHGGTPTRRPKPGSRMSNDDHRSLDLDGVVDSVVDLDDIGAAGMLDSVHSSPEQDAASLARTYKINMMTRLSSAEDVLNQTGGRLSPALVAQLPRFSPQARSGDTTTDDDDTSDEVTDMDANERVVAVKIGASPPGLQTTAAASRLAIAAGATVADTAVVAAVAAAGPSSPSPPPAPAFVISMPIVRLSSKTCRAVRWLGWHLRRRRRRRQQQQQQQQPARTASSAAQEEEEEEEEEAIVADVIRTLHGIAACLRVSPAPEDVAGASPALLSEMQTHIRLEVVEAGATALDREPKLVTRNGLRTSLAAQTGLCLRAAYVVMISVPVRRWS